MRLLNTKTLKVEEFFVSEVPYYAILSHTWGKEEVTLQDIQTSQAEQKAGYSKLRGCCTRAAQDGYDYVWIDTCCIDKTSSAELSEAINSMYRWYQKADICYAYLIDVPTVDVNTITYRDIDGVVTGTFVKSKWFTRGWTLQELIAPCAVEFYSADWTEIGTKSSLRELLSIITGINIRVLHGEDPAICNVAERLSWAASRETSRIEDAAYCLLGMFQVHMPLLYGEGENALVRLQEQILKMTEDYTLLARGTSYQFGLAPRVFHLALTSHLCAFDVGNASPWRYSDLELDNNAETLLRKNRRDIVPHITPTLTAKGLHICLPLLKVSDIDYLAYIYCRLKGTEELMCIPLRAIDIEASRFKRILQAEEGQRYYQLLPAHQITSFQLTTLFIRQDHAQSSRRKMAIKDSIPYVVNIGGINITDKCTVLASWGETASALPWTSRKLDRRKSSGSPDFGFTDFWVLFVLGSGDNFIVKFGFMDEKPWCYIFLEPQAVPKHFLSKDHWQRRESWEHYASSFPEFFADRAIERLRSNLGTVYVSIRNLSSQFVVSVQIKPRMSGDSIIDSQ